MDCSTTQIPDLNFTAIDFETANFDPWSICQIGLVRYENGFIESELSLLVQPPDNLYRSRFIAVHGITPAHTEAEPTFDELWHLIEPYITGQVVVAHNGHSFDFRVLASTLRYYDLEVPDYTKICTYRIYKKGLARLCEEYNIPLNHHDALSDARACALLYELHVANELNATQ